MTGPLTRRAFVARLGKTAAAASALTMVPPRFFGAQKRRYAIVGTGIRACFMIYDNMSVIVKYTNGATMNYALNAFLPFEGYRIAFNGELGRLEVRDYERQPWDVSDSTEIIVTKSFGEREKVDVPIIEGDHGGGDKRLRDTVWRGAEFAPYLVLPDSRAGAMSCLTGIAARKSIEEGRTVRIADLVRF